MSAWERSGVIAGLVGLGVGLVACAFIIREQQKAIDGLVRDAAIGLEADRINLEYATTLHRTLNNHIEDGCISKPAEEKLLKQMDLLIAASRSGWRAAERLAATYEYQEALQ